MVAKRELKKYFESILGRQLDIDLDGELVVRERVGIDTVQLEGSLTARDIGTTGASTKVCSSVRVRDVSGTTRTGSDGTATFPLSDFHCGEIVSYIHPVQFVATPQSRSPVYLTAVQTLTGNRQDVTIMVYAWDMNGTPAPNVSFDWRCRTPFSPRSDL